MSQINLKQLQAPWVVKFSIAQQFIVSGFAPCRWKVIKLPIIKIIHSLVIWFLTTWMTDRRPWHWSLSTEGPKIIQNLLQQSFRNRTKPIFLSNQVCAINASAAFPGVIISFPGDNVLHVTHRLTPFCHSSGRANLYLIWFLSRKITAFCRAL